MAEVDFDQQADQDNGTSAGATGQPSTPDASIEALVNRLNEQIEQRFTGFQSLIDRKFGSLSKQFSDFQRQALTPEEQQIVEEEDAKKEIENLRLENTLYRLRSDHPEAVDLIIGAMKTNSLEDQIAFVESKIGKQMIKEVEKAADEQSADEAQGDSVPNPGTAPKLGADSARFGAEMTEEMADAILSAAPRGSLARKR